MWNYRVVRKKNTYIDPTSKKKRVDYTYAVHEPYYDENGHVGAITQEPVGPFGDNVEELRHSWVMMAEAFGQPVLDYDNIPEPGYDRKKGFSRICTSRETERSEDRQKGGGSVEACKRRVGKEVGSV